MRNRVLKWVFLFLGLAVSACGTSQNRRFTKVGFSDGAVMRPFDGAWWDEAQGGVQEVVYITGQERFGFHAMVEADSDRLTVAGLSVMGARLFLLTVENGHIEVTEQLMFDLPFPPKKMVRDLLMALLPTPRLGSLLPGFKIEQQASVRRLISPDGLVIEVADQRDIDGLGLLTLTRSDNRYRVEVRTVEWQKEGEVSP